LVENSGALIGQESGLVVFEDGKGKSMQRFQNPGLTK
jgi:ligand-binding sensor domain-containing protein